jgi:uncharacterized membrane protein
VIAEDTVDMATTVDVEVHTTIDRPRREVVAYCCDPANVTRWNANIREVQWDSKRPVAVGSLLRFTSGFLGRTLEYTYEVVELVPDERFVMRSEHGSFSMETAYLWADDEAGGTWMTVRNRGEPTGFAGLAAPILATAVRRATAKDLARLKSILECR